MASDGILVAEGKEHALRHELSIGRDESNEIVLAHSTVSRNHARLTFAGGRWCIEDLGSANGTFVNGVRVPFGAPHPLRDGDRVGIGSANLAFAWPAERDDPDRTDAHEAIDPASAPLSPFQLQVVQALCGAWLGEGGRELIASNAQIAAALGTPGAEASVKAALRRVYLKAGLSELPPHAKRRALCRVARTQGWL